MCEAGKYQPIRYETWQVSQYGVLGPPTCLTCPAGKFQPYAGQSSCMACPERGWPNDARTSCVCEPGEYFADFYCLPCEEGYKCVGDGTRVQCVGQGEWSPRRSVTCYYCGPGRYLRQWRSSIFEIGTFTCEVCEPGHWCMDHRQFPCMMGRYQPNPAATTCLHCTGVEYAPWSEVGQLGCDTCTPGQALVTFDSTGWFSCEADCPVLNVGCTACEPGHYCPVGVEQYPCNGGLYQSMRGAESCDDCRDGLDWYTPMDGMPYSECLTCPPGSYITGLGAGNNMTQTNCTLCPAGLACDGTTQRTACYGGTHAPLPGASTCTPCPPGQVSSIPTSSINVAMTSCMVCTPGKVANDDQTECLDCVAGLSCPDGATMLPCNNGTFAGSSSTSCTVCAAGKYTPLIERLEFVLPMEVAATRGYAECLPCPATGYYAAAGASQCLPCPADKVCNAGLLK